MTGIGGWFEGIAPDDVDAAAAAVRDGRADQPRRWPAEAVEAGFVPDSEAYYGRLREATVRATRRAVRERERADDRQLAEAVRAMDDAARLANELAERVAAWGGSLFGDAGSGIDGARELAAREPSTPAEERVVALAGRAADLDAEASELRSFVERRAPAVAPNLSRMAGPVLAARLIAAAGGLEALARKPSGTVQVLGAEDALFAHLDGRAPAPKHGLIYAHEYVHGTRPEDRGSAARALAGKLAIAARIDHYSGEERPGVHEELRERIGTIRARADRDGEADGG